MRAIRRYGCWIRWSMALVLLGSVIGFQFAPSATVASQAEEDTSVLGAGTPEAADSTQSEISDVAPSEIELNNEPAAEQVTSLVVPLPVIVDSTMNTGVSNPCTAIDPGWTFVSVQPAVQTGWVDPVSGMGGELAVDLDAEPVWFGWDGSQGGSVEGAIVPDAPGEPEAPANFYDYRPFDGAIASDAGLSSPSGQFDIAYLCVAAPAERVESPISSVTEPALLDSTAVGTPAAAPEIPLPAGIPVDAAAIGIGSKVRVSEPLNLRTAPGLSATVISVLSAGSVVTVVGGPQSASGFVWWQLSTANGAGWSVVDYLVEQTGTVTATPSVTRTATAPSGGPIQVGDIVRVKQLLNLRDQPTTAGTVLVVMPGGTTGTVLDGPQNANGYSWWRITTALGTGWAAGSYLEKTAGTAVPSNTPTRTATPSGSSIPTVSVTPIGTMAGGIAIGDLVETITRVNLRSASGMQASVIVVLPSGSQWPVIGGPAQASGMTWWQVQTSSGAGWVAAQYLRRIGIAPSPTVTRTPSLTPTITRTPTITSTPGACGSFAYGDIVRTSASVNFRSQPTTSSSIIRTLANGERGTVKGGPASGNGYTWCQIRIGSTTGWVASLYLVRVSGPLPTPNGTVTPRPSSPTPPSSGSSSVIYSGPASSGMIALTFDAGAERGKAEYILDVLASYGVHATFGMTGLWARDNPDLVQRMVSEGHQLINHTWDHPSFTGESTSTTVLTRSGRIDQLDRAEAIVAQISGYQMKPYWRPPYGDINSSVLRDAYAGGYYVAVMWSCDTLAWNGASVQQILNRCMYPSGSGSIILMHVGSDGLDWAATADMIRYFQGKGLQLVTIETLLGG